MNFISHARKVFILRYQLYDYGIPDWRVRDSFRNNFFCSPTFGLTVVNLLTMNVRYDEDWNADLPSIVASSYVSISTAVAYTTPFIGAVLADNLLGEYLTILLGSVAFYIPGLLLIALSTIPNFLGPVFSESAVRWGLLVLWPIGTGRLLGLVCWEVIDITKPDSLNQGSVKACVNVFGAKVIIH